MLFSSIICSGLMAFASALATPTISNTFRSVHTPTIERTAQNVDSHANTHQEIPANNSGDPVDHHNYTFDELKPLVNGEGSNPQPYFRFDLMFKRKPNVTDEYFHQHWKTVHADLTIAAKDCGIQIYRYVQFHQDSYSRKQIAPLLATNAVSLSPYDGMAEFHAKDYKHLEDFLLAAFGDETIAADIDKFVDRGFGLHVMAGYDNVIFGGGVNSFFGGGGTNGILPTDDRLSFSPHNSTESEG